MLTLPTEPEVAPPRRRRPWHDKFKFALRGVKWGVRGHSSFSVHFFFTVLVVAAAIVLQCELWEWYVLLGCIGFVLVAELFNSAIETLFRHLDTKTQARTWPALDIAAGAVLWISLTAALVGTLLFTRRLLEIFG